MTAHVWRRNLIVATGRFRTGGFAAPAFGSALATGLTLELLLSDFGAWSTIALLAVNVVALVVAFEVAKDLPWLIPTSIVGALAVAFFIDAPGILSAQPAAGILGYANAKAALYGQGAVAAAMVAIRARRRATRVASWVVAVAFAIVPVASKSLAATVGVVGVAGLLAVPRRWWRRAVFLCAIAFLGLLTATMVVAAGNDNLVSRGLDDRRSTLWREAWTMMIGAPVRGVGANGFVETSPTAVSDRDAAWVHNEFLEMGAEHGIAAPVLTVAIVVWLLWKLSTAVPRGGRHTLLGAAALTALAAQASVDYVAHFAAVPLVAALLVGTALGTTRRATPAARMVPPLRSTRA